MKIKFLKGITAVVVFIVVFIVFLSWQQNSTTTNIAPQAPDYKNLTYVIENRNIKLENGVSQIEAAPGSASKIITKYFGNEATGDLNKDTISDAAFLLIQESGGSGVFYYLVAVLKTNAGYQVTNTIFLGDRIAPQTTQINDGDITVNYTDRKPGEAMTAVPSIGVSKYFTVGNGILTKQFPIAMLGSTVTLSITNPVKFSDGPIVMLSEINDSRCKPGMVCIWAGELSPLLIVTLNGNQQELRLGSTTAQQATKSGYLFELKEVTQTTATIVVKKEIENTASCYVGGCSNEICSDKEGIVSVCIYKKEYACYKKTTCARQESGQCGWTQTPELKTCLNTN